MDKSNDKKNNRHHDVLANIELPEIELPLRQRRLREALLQSGYAEKDKIIDLAKRKQNKGISGTKPGIWVIAASIVVLLFSYGFYYAFLTAPQVVANVTLQVNPAINLSIGERNTVVDAIGLDEQGQQLLSGLNLKGQQVQDVLRIITNALHEVGILSLERRILVAVSPVSDMISEPDITILIGTVRNTISKYLMEQGLLLDVKIALLSEELTDVVLASGLMPLYYVDLVDAVGSEIALQVLALEKESGIDSILFKQELDTISALFIDMLDAGISAENALVAIKTALNADTQLTMLSTIIDALINLVEEGLSLEEALMAIQQAIHTDPTLQDFDELIELSEDDNPYETDEIDDAHEMPDDDDETDSDVQETDDTDDQHELPDDDIPDSDVQETDDIDDQHETPDDDIPDSDVQETDDIDDQHELPDDDIPDSDVQETDDIDDQHELPDDDIPDSDGL